MAVPTGKMIKCIFFVWYLFFVLAAEAPPILLYKHTIDMAVLALVFIHVQPWWTTLQKCSIKQQKYAFGTQHLCLLLFLKHYCQFPECTAVSLLSPWASPAVLLPPPLPSLPPPSPPCPALSLPLWHALCSCTAAFPSILLSVCLIAGDRYVVYLTQNRTPLLFQRVEPGSQDGGPGLNNALPPPDAADNVNSLWDTLFFFFFPLLPTEGFRWHPGRRAGQTEGRVNGEESHSCACPRRPVEGGIPESQSWMTDRAQEISQMVGWSPDGQPEDGSITNSQVEKRPLWRVASREHKLSAMGKAQKAHRDAQQRAYTWGEKRKKSEKFWAPECLHTLLHSASVPTFMPSLPHEPPPCLRVLRKLFLTFVVVV